MDNVSAKRANREHQVTVEYEFGTNLEGALELFEEEVVFELFKRAAVTDLQNFIRRQMFNDDDVAVPSEIVQDLVNEWEPGTAHRRAVAKVAKLTEQATALSTEDREALIAQLQAASSPPLNGGTDPDEGQSTTAH